MKKVASKYAAALFELALDQKLEEPILKDVRFIEDIIITHPELITVLSKIQFTKTQKKELINDVFRQYLNPYTLNLLFILVDKNRSMILEYFVSEYLHLHNKHFKIVEAIAYSVTPMTKEEIKALEQSLSEKQNQSVSVINRIDPTLISGIKVRYDDKVIDGSMKSRIENLRTVLREGRST
jgi:F-type H+-transporting ATPase subunit delta